LFKVGFSFCFDASVLPWRGRRFFSNCQGNLSASTLPTRINYQNGTEYTDFKIPSIGGKISFTLNGGDGGRRRVPNLCTRKGGEEPYFLY
jgi:hypothetical protein